MATNVSRFTGLLFTLWLPDRKTKSHVYGRRQIKLITQTYTDNCIQPARRLLGVVRVEKAFQRCNHQGHTPQLRAPSVDPTMLKFCVFCACN